MKDRFCWMKLTKTFQIPKHMTVVGVGIEMVGIGTTAAAAADGAGDEAGAAVDVDGDEDGERILYLFVTYIKCSPHWWSEEINIDY